MVHGPHKSFNKLNFLLVNVESLWSCAHYFQWFTGYWLTHVLCTCFKETTLLFNVHLSCFMNFILCPTDKYTFKVHNEKVRLISWMCWKLKLNTTWHLSNVFVVNFDQSQYVNIAFLLLTVGKYLSGECER